MTALIKIYVALISKHHEIVKITSLLKVDDHITSLQVKVLTCNSRGSCRVFTDSVAHMDTILDHFVLTFNNQNKLMFISDTSIHKEFFKHRIIVYETIRRETCIVKIVWCKAGDSQFCRAGSCGRPGHRTQWWLLGTCPPPPLGVLEVIQSLVRGVPLTPEEPLQQLLGARLVPHHLI